MIAAIAALLCACETIAARRQPAYHRVRAGDTLAWIAQGYGVSVDRLARENRIRDPKSIAAGQILRIPNRALIVHRVHEGESLENVARRYSVPVSTIAWFNRMRTSDRIEVGQRLILPPQAVLPAEKTKPKAVAAKTPPRAPPPTAPTDAPDPQIERAEELVDHAFEEYRAARFESALESARDAEETLASVKGSAAARSLSARTAFVTGSALAAIGETDRAVESFARVHALAPGFTPPNGWMSPRLEDLYESAKPE